MVSHPNTSQRRVRTNRRQIFRRLASRPPQVPALARGTHLRQARSGYFFRKPTNIPFTRPSFFHRHTDHPGVSMDTLTPLDFYFAGSDVESPHRYRPGGYHPIHLGDVYSQRYRVIHKLGFGTYSTVWLVRDLQSTVQT